MVRELIYITIIDTRCGICLGSVYLFLFDEELGAVSHLATLLFQVSYIRSALWQRLKCSSK